MKLSHRRPMSVEKFWFGAAYYPEHWEEKDRERDGELMKKANFNMVRMAEFAWNMFEPKEGTFDFTFFDDAIERLGKDGVETMMCTPTAAPPIWVTMKYPDTVRVDCDGRKMLHGSRQQCCHSNLKFRELSRAVTQAMADHYAGNPHVKGWQTDNELNCHFSECHCDSCQVEFRNFLRRKFNGDIKLLNKTWGNSFWALEFSDFDEIETPRNQRPAHSNPSHVMDYYRFINDSVTRFQHEQVEILRKANPDWFIQHNGFFSHIDYRGEFAEELDFMGYDCYPFFAYNSEKRESKHAYNCDRARSYAGNFIVPEHQAGPGGQAPYMHDTPEPGELRKITYRTISRGADSLLYFRWRTCRFGAEEHWHGIIEHDNVPRRRFEEVSQIGEELKTVWPEIEGTHVHVDCAVAASDFDMTEAWRTYSLGLPSPDEIASCVHKVFNEERFAIGLVHPEDDLGGIKLYVIPHWTLVKPEWLPKLSEYVENGGVLVVGARTGTNTPDNSIVSTPAPGLLAELCGVEVKEYGKRVVEEQTREIFIDIDGENIPAGPWYEALDVSEDVEVLCRWNGRHLTGEPAVTRRNVGKGAVFYVGAYFTEEICAALMSKLVSMANLHPVWSDAPKGVEVVVRAKAGKRIWFFINNTDETVTVPSAPLGMDLVAGEKSDGEPFSMERHGVRIIATS